MSSAKKKQTAKRRDRRFTPQSAQSPWIARIAGALGAVSLGAGTWGYVYGHVFEGDEKLKAVPQYLIAGGAVLMAVAIWFRTSSDPPLRVGDPGIGIERGELRRMPWWGVDTITWESGSLALGITGKDESGAPFTFKVPLKSHPDAVAHIVAEAEARIPAHVDIPEEVRKNLPQASPLAGTKIDLEPLQIVGKRCAATGKTISYEPDGRVCSNCERVYFKKAVPKKCKCGASLADLRPASTDDDDKETDEADD
ncbi:MAG: hypothetical protein FWD69_04425 [Polyangiaceae bacterium]|nr:hypothetical protein [Polyangiaceae bacterium]